MLLLCFCAEKAKRRRRIAPVAGVLYTLLAALPSLALANVKIVELQGDVQFRGVDPNSGWKPAALHYLLTPGEALKTGKKSKAVLLFPDRSKVELGAKSDFSVEGATENSADVGLGTGRLKAWVEKAVGKSFKVRTPTAVCSVRGTQFGVDVRNGNTTVELFQGLLGVADKKGNEALLTEGQRLEVTPSGMGEPGSIQGAAEAERARERQALKREVGLDMSKDDIIAAAADELKSAIYQQGKALVDVNGNRVRIEEYIIRPAANQFKLVVLNHRVDRFDYFYYLGTFNKAIPDDLKSALRELPGCVGGPCQFYLTQFQTGRSNTQDSVLEDASGGHMSDVNNNGVAGDDVAFAFDTSKNDFVTLSANQPFFRTLFDTYNLAFNGVSHHKWSPKAGIVASTLANCPTGICGAGIGVKSYGSSTGAGDDRALTDLTNLIQPPNCESLDQCTGTRTPGKFHDVQYLQNADGSIWEKFENYIIKDDGKIVDHAAFAGVTSGADFKKRLLEINYEQIVTASEFNGRKIDLVVEPKIFIESGLIP